MSLFGGDDQSLNITLKAKDEASAEIAKVKNSVGELAKGVALGTIAVDALRTGFRLLSGFMTDSLKEFEQLNQATAQTNAVLASTKHAAGLTATEIVNLSKSLSDNTLYQDDMVLSAENMLLTFTNITKDIFPQTTKAVLDMSTALGEDLQSSAIQLGKALQDPILGVTALARVGVAFTSSQKEMISTMVKSGQTMEAQKFILAEIEKEFGGSAKSAYESASSVTKLEKSIVDLKQEVGSGLTPALNNVFSAFQDVNSGMGKTVDVGKVVFQTFSMVGEFAANTAAGIHFLAGEMVKFTSQQLQFIAGPLNLIKGVRDGFSDFNDSVQEGIDTTANFAMDLHDKNEAVLKSWGDVTEEARIFGKVGPAAYQATAAEATAAKKKIDDAKTAIKDTKTALEDLQKSLLSDDKAKAQAFVDQQGKVSDIRKQLTTETDPDKIADLKRQLSREQGALDTARPQFTGGTMGGLTSDALQRSTLTDFERNLQDITDRKMDRVTTDLPKILLNVNFNDAVVGNDGIVRLIQQTIDTINRQTTLKSSAGA